MKIYLELVRVESGELQSVEVLQEFLDLVRPVDVRHRVDPVPGGRGARRHVRRHRESRVEGIKLNWGYIQIGEDYWDGKYTLSVSLDVSFCGDLESK